MQPLLFILLISMAPAATLWLLIRAVKWFTSGDPLPWRPAKPSPAARSIELLTQDLARLEREFARIHRDQPPAMARRLMALTLAYDDTLAACCAALDLAPPDHTPMDDIERLQTEAVLAQHGLRW
ncbi:MAG TPA: hypothetical protein VFJ97_11935 [Dermatophilaceae bacterium]|nr:hypothetical protein [Dermatophilaceae bacterium]